MGSYSCGGFGVFRIRRRIFRAPILSISLALMLSLCLSACLGPSLGPLKGTLTGPQRWKGTIRIGGDLIIEEGSHLVIEPGTEVVFLPPEPGSDTFQDHPYFPGSELIVRGHLSAMGTPEAPIVFRFVDTAAPAGSWGGINIQGSSASAFGFCRFEQADSAIHSNESQVVVRQSIFERNLVGIRFNSTPILIEHNTLRHNGTGIRFHFGAPEIRHNRVFQNDKGFFITSHPRQYLIRDNVITGNEEADVVLGEEVPEDVDMRENYWGTLGMEEIESGFFDGRIDSDLGLVIYSPTLSREVTNAGASWDR